MTRRTSVSRARVVRSMISLSSSSAGYVTRSLKRNRSSWASGSGYVPSISIGFWVARTKNGDGRGCEIPDTVAVPSCIPSSSADWVLGVARFTSSARRMWPKIGPFWNWKCLRPSGSSRMMFVPMMSAGMRSGVNWIRENESSSPAASVLTRRVLPRPGAPSSRTCPPAKSPTRTSVTTSSYPTMIFPTSPLRRPKASMNSWTRSAFAIMPPFRPDEICPCA